MVYFQLGVDLDDKTLLHIAPLQTILTFHRSSVSILVILLQLNHTKIIANRSVTEQYNKIKQNHKK